MRGLNLSPIDIEDHNRKKIIRIQDFKKVPSNQLSHDSPLLCTFNFGCLVGNHMCVNIIISVKCLVENK